jgi:hypothetical protein
MWHVGQTEEKHTGVWCGDLMEAAHLQDLGVDRSITFRSNFKKWDVEAWTGLIWLRIVTGGMGL